MLGEIEEEAKELSKRISHASNGKITEIVRGDGKRR